MARFGVHAHRMTAPVTPQPREQPESFGGNFNCAALTWGQVLSPPPCSEKTKANVSEENEVQATAPEEEDVTSAVPTAREGLPPSLPEAPGGCRAPGLSFPLAALQPPPLTGFLLICIQVPVTWEKSDLWG